MIFHLFRDTYTKRGSVWAQAGEYRIVRMFDAERVLVVLWTSPEEAGHTSRTLTLLRKNRGEIL